MRIIQNARYLKDVLRTASSGALVPAAFQRPYVWSRKDVLSLMESLRKGYPTGSLLLWTPYNHADLSRATRTRLGPLPPANDEGIESVLLDGQNRLATLAWVASDSTTPLPEDLTEHERTVWGQGDILSVDLETETFAFIAVEDLEKGLRMPARALLDYTIANSLLRARWNGPWQGYSEDRITEAVSKFERMQEAIMNAQVTVTDIQKASIEEARDAFLHICRVGVPMTEKDFDAALNWSREKA